jgi:glycine oxidase
MNYDIAIIGNGIIGCSLALKLSLDDPTLSICVIGSNERKGCASTAAGAMLASFAELDEHSLQSEFGRYKFDLSRKASLEWDSWAGHINNKLSSSNKVPVHRGTIVINNCKGDIQDEKTFNAILQATRDYNEAAELINPNEISGLDPDNSGRIIRALLLKNEGYIPADTLFTSIDCAIENTSTIEIVDANVVSLAQLNKSWSLETSKGEKISAGKVVIASGVESQKFFDKLGISSRIPKLFYGIGTAIIFKNERPPRYAVRTVNRGLACGVHLVPRINSCYVGASNFISPVAEYTPRLTSLHAILESTMTELNCMFYKMQLENIAVGFRPTSADTYPLVGATSIENFYILTGTKRDGIHMSPLYVQEMSKAILTGHECFNGIFKPERKLIKTLTKEEGVKLAVQHLTSAGYQHGLNLPTAGWKTNISDMLREKVEEAYERSGITDYGIPPELLDMYRYGHIRETSA